MPDSLQHNEAASSSPPPTPRSWPPPRPRSACPKASPKSGAPTRLRWGTRRRSSTRSCLGRGPCWCGCSADGGRGPRGSRSCGGVARGCGIPLLAFGGEAEPDAELTALSTVPSGTVLEAFEYLRHGGVGNTENLLRFVADTVLMEGYGFEPASPLPEVGVYHPLLAGRLSGRRTARAARPRRGLPSV